MVTLALLCAIAIGACGGGAHKTVAARSSSPAQLVSQTVSASNAINSGRISLTLDVKLDGIKALGGKPISLSIDGPFARSGRSVSTDLSAKVAIASSSADIGIDRVAGQTYLGLGGVFYQLPAATGATAALGASGASGLRGASGESGLLNSLGIDPAGWLTDPHELAQSTVGGVATDHLRAQINVAAVLGDVSKLMGAAGASSTSTSNGVLTLLQSAINSAQVDVYTGVSDHIVRRFDLAIAFTVPALAAGEADGLTGGSLNLNATLTDLNQPQTISAPANPQPSSKLLNGIFALESQFGSLASLASGLPSGA